MSFENLSPNWSWVKLGDVCEINPKLNANGLTDNVEVSFLPMKAVQELSGKINLSETRMLVKVKKGYTYFGDGDVIFAKITPCMENGKVAITRKLKNGIGFGSTEFHVFRPNNNLLNTYLFFFLIQGSYRNIAQRNMTGTAGQLRVPKRFIENSEIPLPPLSEQKKIVEKIEELFSDLENGVASFKKAREQIKLYRQSVLASAFNGKLTADHPELVSGSNGLPKGWKLKSVRDISDDMIIGIVKSAKEQFKDKKGVPYIKMNNVSMEGKVDVSDVVNVEVTSDELEKFILRKGDILFNTRNSYELVGKTGIVKDDKLKRIYNNNLLRIRVNKDFNADFINYQINSHGFKEKLKSGKRATTNICAIYQKDLFPMQLIIPSLPLQTQIVEEIESRFAGSEALEKSIDESLTKSEALRQSILKHAFEGRLLKTKEGIK